MKWPIKQAWVNLWSAKLRSFLAVLGILVGSAAVVALMNSGQLATEKALEEFQELGTDLLSVSLYPKNRNEKLSGEAIPLHIWRQIPKRIPGIEAIAPYTTHYTTLSFQGLSLQAPIIAADESLTTLVHIELAEGHFVSFVENFERFCVIGHDLAKRLQQKRPQTLMGQHIRMDATLYTIIGIAKPWKENGFFNEDINQAVIIPLGGIRLVSKDAKINNAVLLLRPDSPIDEVVEDLKQNIHSVAPKLNVFPRSAKQIIASMESQGQIFTLLLGVIGGISLLVGGIGVMNVMLVSVSERKKEIGIRKAVGAKNSEIQALFLVESILLSLLGGILGVILGLIFTWIVAYFSHWEFSIYWLPPIAGFLVSAATGVFFGFYPAWRAAKLEPMVSLRSE